MRKSQFSLFSLPFSVICLGNRKNKMFRHKFIRRNSFWIYEKREEKKQAKSCETNIGLQTGSIWKKYVNTTLGETFCERQIK